MGGETDLERTAAELRGAGCVAAEEEAAELIAVAAGNAQSLEALVARRCAGEPLAWLSGCVEFCGERVLVHRGVYVPRWQSEPLALEAAVRLPGDGIAVDLCTGSGAIALVLGRRRPAARVVGTEIDPVAAACARANGVNVYERDMADGLADELGGRVDVVVAVVPYVPSAELRLLPRDVTAYEPRRALDGGADGTDYLLQAAHQARALLRAGGSLLLELGGDEGERLRPVLEEHGYREIEFLMDEDGDLRALVCRH